MANTETNKLEMKKDEFKADVLKFLAQIFLGLGIGAVKTNEAIVNDLLNLASITIIVYAIVRPKSEH